MERKVIEDAVFSSLWAIAKVNGHMRWHKHPYWVERMRTWKLKETENRA